MRINVAIPEAHVDAPVLDAALEATTRLNEAMLKTGQVPTFEDGLKTGIQWKPEPPGAEHFDHAEEVMRRKWGDCDDLAPWQAASLRHTGEDPGATAIVRKSGPKRWHAIVRRSDGSIEDPSKAAGMGRSSVVGFDYEGIAGAALPLMYEPPSQAVGGSYIVRPAIAIRPHLGNWQARADLPWNWREHMALDKPTPADYAMVSLHQDPVAQTALTGAIDGAIQIGCIAGFADPEHVHRLCALSDAIEGASYEQLCGIYGEEHARAATELVGSIFKKLGKIAKGVAKGVAKGAAAAAHAAAPVLKLAKPFIKYIPGIGPVASDVMEIAEKASKVMNMHPNEIAKLMQSASSWPAVPGSVTLGHGLVLGDDLPMLLGEQMQELGDWLDAP